MKAKIADGMKTALKAGDKERLGVLRMMKSEIDAVETRDGKVDPEQVVLGYAKKLQKAIDEYERLGRADAVEQNRRELAVVEEFLPEALTDEELSAAVDQIVAEGE